MEVRYSFTSPSDTNIVKLFLFCFSNSYISFTNLLGVWHWQSDLYFYLLTYQYVYVRVDGVIYIHKELFHTAPCTKAH